MTTLVSAREFNQDVSAAKRAAQEGPVVVTDRGTPAYVLLSYEQYNKLTKPAHADGHKLIEALSMEEDIDIDFAPVEITVQDPEF
ncbi:type II toxin-antitoxin system Phd/YefM family antitoxin [Rothia terrae]|uniref:Antitoxin n=1 Tax=Rothia terrae TaxID=396015 RepID=A0A7H2BET7_9MICC|nr:type II toxin-antitoxin system Phd/YefM family antitoxin [Rothia terrae]MDT0189932.1 type II toxin-antitoxin system Phd/YefM family antitoxin [Rothia terrae]NKZ34372.1 type II toxin-antitoxin system Phd/YefM family antitoxin [Rothia terrae]QNV38183.1 type II toxin-antitoxin system Phd/YefM family antitoxin [Rothia terrae]